MLEDGEQIIMLWGTYDDEGITSITFETSIDRPQRTSLLFMDKEGASVVVWIRRKAYKKCILIIINLQGDRSSRTFGRSQEYSF